MKLLDIDLAASIQFDKSFKADFNNDGVTDKLVCSNQDFSVKIFDGKNVRKVLYHWAGPPATTTVTNKAQPNVISKRHYSGCITTELVAGRPSVVISTVFIHPTLGLRIPSPQFVLQNQGLNSDGTIKMAFRRITTGDGVQYTAAARSVKCTPYPEKLVAKGNPPGVLCFFAGYDQNLPGGLYGTKTALFKLEEKDSTLVAKDLTPTSGLLWSGGATGTPLKTFGTAAGKYDGLSMMSSAWLDYDKDGLPDLITAGQHSSLRASKMVMNESKPEDISFTTSNIVKASSKTMTEFLTVTAFNEQDDRISRPCIYLTGEVGNLSSVKPYDVPDHVRCYENDTWVLHMLPGKPAYSSDIRGPSIKVNAAGNVVILAPSLYYKSGKLVSATPPNNLFEVKSNDTCQIKLVSELKNADNSKVLKSVSEIISVAKGTSPRIGGWVDCGSTKHNAYFTGTTFTSGSSNITQLGWWTEADFLSNQAAFNKITWKSSASFVAMPKATKSVRLWNGCAKTNAVVTATVTSCTDNKIVMDTYPLASGNSQTASLPDAAAITPEFISQFVPLLLDLLQRTKEYLR